MSVHFDMDNVNPGGGTMAYIPFATPNGVRYAQAYRGTLQMEKPLQGREGQKRAIILTMNGYGLKHYYEWREAD